jgi:hypothetical protein
MTLTRFRILPSWLAAGIAAVAGMKSCYATLAWSWSPSSRELQHGRWIRSLAFFSPFLIGAVVAGVAFVLLARRDSAAAATDAAAQINDPDFDILPSTPRRRRTGARSLFVSIVGASGAIGALMVGFFAAMGGDGGPPDTTTDMLVGAWSGGIQGAIIGAVFGSMIALPAAAIVWMLRRGRRKPSLTPRA